MTFECDGVHYHSEKLLAFGTGDRCAPLVHLTRDYSRVFVLEVNHWDGARVRQVTDRAEVKELAARLGIDDLLRAIS